MSVEKIQKKLNKITSRPKQKKYKLYIFRFFADGTRSNAKPCAECSRWMSLVKCLGIHYEIYYTDEYEKITSYKFDCNHYLPSGTYF